MTKEENLSLHIIDNYVPSREYDHEKDNHDPTKHHLKHFQRREAGINVIVQGQGQMSSKNTVYNSDYLHSGWNRLEKGT